MENEEDIKAIFAAARAIQSSASAAVAELQRLVADNQAIPAQIAQQGSRAVEAVPKTVRNATAPALLRIEQGAEAAMRKAAISDVGARMAAALAVPIATAEGAIQRLNRSAQDADHAAKTFRLSTRVLRSQHLAIAVLAGVLLGSVGTWYFASQPLRAAADYILIIKQAREQRDTVDTQAAAKANLKPDHKRLPGRSGAARPGTNTQDNMQTTAPQPQ